MKRRVTTKPAIRIGLLFSLTGPYATICRSMAAGARLAIEELAVDPAMPFRLEPVALDPGGQTQAYADAARRLLVDERITHVVGCYTSSSRKEVLPLFEKHDALLWYPSHYEGFESSENVVYTGAAPNQHIIPLVEYLLRAVGRRCWCIGSNYIWAWENNKIMREAILGAGGTVMAERYVPVGETDLEPIVTQILDARPDFVFNTLIGDSAYAFFRSLRRLARARGIDQPKAIPVASCSLAEPELVEIGPEAADGHLSSSVYFEAVETTSNGAFIRAFKRRFPELGPTSADAEASYVTVHLLGRALRDADGSSVEAVLRAVTTITFDAPQGPVRIEPANRHAHLTPRIGLSTATGGFRVIYEAPGPVPPDPYLVWHEPREVAQPRRQSPSLRVVR